MLEGQDKKDYQKAYMRDRRSNKQEPAAGSNKQGSNTVEPRPGSYEHHQLHPDQYYPRDYKTAKNWGAWMNADELKLAGFTGNRVSVLGDCDYAGLCVTQARVTRLIKENIAQHANRGTRSIRNE